MNAQQYAWLLRNSRRRRGPAPLAEGIARALRTAANDARRSASARLALERVLDPSLFERVSVLSFRKGVVVIRAEEEIVRRHIAQQRGALVRDLRHSLPGVVGVRVVASREGPEDSPGDE